MKSNPSPSPLARAAVGEFERDFKCINEDCDGLGNIPHQVAEDEWEAQQCQYCFEVRFKQRDWLRAALVEAHTAGKREAECCGDCGGWDGQGMSIEDVDKALRDNWLPPNAPGGTLPA